MGVRLTLVAIVAAALFGSTACGTERPSAQPAAQAASSFSFKAETLDGKTFDGASLSGRPTVLWFWAPWCGTCAGQASSVTDVAARHRDKVNVVGVAGLGDAKEMKEFVRDTGAKGFVQLADESGAVWKRFGVTEQSTYVLVDAAGKVVHKGWLDTEAFDAAVAKLAG